MFVIVDVWWRATPCWNEEIEDIQPKVSLFGSCQEGIQVTRSIDRRTTWIILRHNQVIIHNSTCARACGWGGVAMFCAVVVRVGVGTARGDRFGWLGGLGGQGTDGMCHGSNLLQLALVFGLRTGGKSIDFKELQKRIFMVCPILQVEDTAW